MKGVFEKSMGTIPPPKSLGVNDKQTLRIEPCKQAMYYEGSNLKLVFSDVMLALYWTD